MKNYAENAVSPRPEEIQKCEGYEALNYDEAVIAAKSIRLFTELLIEVYLITGRI